MNRIILAFLALPAIVLLPGCSSVPTYSSVPDIPRGTAVQLGVVIPEWHSANTLTDSEGVVLLGTGGAAAGAVSGAAIGLGATPSVIFTSVSSVVGVQNSPA